MKLTTFTFLFTSLLFFTTVQSGNKKIPPTPSPSSHLHLIELCTQTISKCRTSEEMIQCEQKHGCKRPFQTVTSHECKKAQESCGYVLDECTISNGPNGCTTHGLYPVPPPTPSPYPKPHPTPYPKPHPSPHPSPSPRPTPHPSPSPVPTRIPVTPTPTPKKVPVSKACNAMIDRCKTTLPYQHCLLAAGCHDANDIKSELCKNAQKDCAVKVWDCIGDNGPEDCIYQL